MDLTVKFSNEPPEIKPVNSSLKFDVQQNEIQNGLKKTVLVANVLSLYATSAEYKITKWFLTTDSNGTLEISPRSELGYLLNYASNKTLTDALITSNDVSESKIFQFFIQTNLLNSTNNTFINRQPIHVTLKIGCFKERLTNFWTFLPNFAVSNPNVIEQQEGKVVLLFPRSQTKSEVNLNLSKIFRLSADFEGCGASAITAYSDPLKLHLALSQPLYLEGNPLKPGLVDPIVRAEFSNQKLDKTIYLEAKANSDSSEAGKHQMNITVQTCDDKPQLSGVQKKSFIFTMLQPEQKISIGEFFKYQAQTPICNKSELVLSETNAPPPSLFQHDQAKIQGNELVINTSRPGLLSLFVVMKSVTSLNYVAM